MTRPPLPCLQEPLENQARLCRQCRTSEDPFRRCSQISAESDAFRRLLDRAALVAPSDISVLILGESGTGKEVLARGLHANSRRAKAPFLAVNLAALPSELLESELFGHRRGAFTGADQHKAGMFEAAEGGTLLLDEVGEMPINLQAKLLRALQDGEIRRVGDVESRRVDVRIICATHQDLDALVNSGRFRSDLYFRLRGIALRVPPLRERKADIMPLAHRFLSRENHPTGAFTPAAERLVRAYAWPGNVRELINAVRHGAVLSAGKDVAPEHLPEELGHAPGSRPPRPSDPPRPLAEVEKAHILSVMDHVDGEVGEAARILGLSRTTLWRKLSSYGHPKRNR